MKIISKGTINPDLYTKLESVYNNTQMSEDYLNKVLPKIHLFSMVDKTALWFIWNMVKHTMENVDKGSFIEVGSWKGGSCALIAWAAYEYGYTGPVYLCDTFKGVVKAGPKDNLYVGGEHADTNLELVQQFLYDRHKLKQIQILEGIFPEESAHLLPEDETFRFCHIDVDVYQSAHDVLEYIWPRLEVGGVVVYDDYGFAEFLGIKAHVDEHAEDDDKFIFQSQARITLGSAAMVKLK